MSLPRELGDAYSRSGAAQGRSFQDDVLWGQYCLFWSFRLKDDVFDGDTRERAGIFVGDLYLVEAERTFARHFPRTSEFWRVFHRCVHATASGILEVDRLQRSSRGAPNRLLDASARVDSVFHVGLTAVCLKHGQTRVLRRLLGAIREAGIAAQIFDDLRDVEQDLRRGRRSYAARVAVRRGAARSSAGGRAAGPAILSGDGVLHVIGEARERLRRAARLLRGLPCPVTLQSITQSIQAADTLAQAVRRRQVRAVFGR